MAITYPAQVSFNAGEFGLRMLARSDFHKYRSAVRRGENVILLPQGGASRRPGSRYVFGIKDSDTRARLIPFQFSTSQAYVIEAGNQYLAFFRNQGQITASDIDVSITGDNSTFGSSIGSWSDVSGGTADIDHDATNERMSLNAKTTPATNYARAELQVTNSTAQTILIRFQVIGAPGDTVKLRVGTSSEGTELINDQVCGVGYHVTELTATAADFYVCFTFDENAKTVQIDNVGLLDDQAVELVTPYTQAQALELRWVQSNDVLHLFHGSVPTYRLLRLGHASWSLEEVDCEDGPYFDENIDTSVTLTSAATTGLGITVTASDTKGINDNQGFLSTDVGRLVSIGDGTERGYGIIVAVNSTTSIDVDIRGGSTNDGFPNTTANHEWRLGKFSGTTGYPKVGHFHEQRLVVANTTTDPDQYWLSQVGDFYNMAPDSDASGAGVETQDDDALDYRLSSDQVNDIRWLQSGEDLFVGTAGAEWKTVHDGAVITPSDIDARIQTRMGSSDVEPVHADNAVIFLQRGNRQVHEFAFSFEADGFRSPDLTILSPQITKSGVSEMAYAQIPDSQILCRRNDGRIATLTYKREQDVVGWARWMIGGTFNSSNAVVESIAVIPGNNGAGQVQDSTERDEIWMIVKRTINGSTARYVEVMEESFEGPDPNDYTTEADYETDLLDAQTDAYYADSIITYDGAATTTISGLDHLEGETVKILADGAVHGDRTVSGGSITLEEEYSTVQIGLGYFHDIEPLIADFGNRAGSALTLDKDIGHVGLLLHETGSVKMGRDRASLRDIPLRKVSDAMDTAVPLFSGILVEDLSDGLTLDPRAIHRNDDPTPFTLLGFVYGLDTAIPG